MRNTFYHPSAQLGFFLIVLAVILTALVVGGENRVSRPTTTKPNDNSGRGYINEYVSVYPRYETIGNMNKGQQGKSTDQGGTLLHSSGIKGTTSFMVVSGVQRGGTTGGPASMEFAIAPIENNTPIYSKAIFIRSDKQGKFEVTLPPGKYWIGPKAKVLDPVHYVPGAVSFSEKVVVVEKGVFTQVDLSEVGYAP